MGEEPTGEGLGVEDVPKKKGKASWLVGILQTEQYGRVAEYLWIGERRAEYHLYEPVGDGELRLVESNGVAAVEGADNPVAMVAATNRNHGYEELSTFGEQVLALPSKIRSPCSDRLRDDAG